MYQPTHFKETDSESIYALIRSNPLGTLVVSSECSFDVNHIPFVLDTTNNGALTLRAHMPKANPLAETSGKDRSCVVIFQGAHGYVSPSWYSTKKKHGKVVPTWNYAVVHIHGTLSLIDDSAWLAQQLDDLTQLQEAERDVPWHVSDAPEEFTEKQRSFLIGLQIQVNRIEAKTKASQNQPAENRESTLASLRTEQPDSGFTAMMEAVHKPV